MVLPLRRLLLAALTILLVLTVTFAGVHLAPGDPVALYLGPSADAAAAAAMRHQVGLDRPLPLQYLAWPAMSVRPPSRRCASRRCAQRAPRDWAKPGC